MNSWPLVHEVSSTVAVGYSPWTGGYYEQRPRDLAATLRKFLLDLKYGTGARYVNSPYALACMLQGQLNSYGIGWRGARDMTTQMLMTGTSCQVPFSSMGRCSHAMKMILCTILPGFHSYHQSSHSIVQLVC